MSQRLGVSTALAEDLCLTPAPTSGSSQMPVTPAPADLAPVLTQQVH